MWQFLSVSENRDVLAWIGGGIAVVAGALWAVFRYQAERRKPGAKPDPAVAVSGRDGLMAGGDVSVHGSVHVGDAVLPRLTLALAAFGMLLLFLALLSGGQGDVVTNGVAAGGDIEGSTITVGTIGGPKLSPVAVEPEASPIRPAVTRQEQ
jgi:hypothetical protein